MSESNFQKILIDYRALKETYSSFTKTVIQIIENLLKREKIQIQGVSGRVKTEDKLRDKIIRKQYKYKNLNEITDISGVRIICFFENDLERIEKTIRKEFLVDEKNSIDKRKYLDPEIFGYLSIHLVVSLSAERVKLSEYSQFNSFLTEIQIRTNLQHSWAEIEHDLGYKANSMVPPFLRRSFSTLAGLLELADQEFQRIKNESVQFSQGLDFSATDGLLNVPISKETILKFVKENETINFLDAEIANFCESRLNFDEESVERYASVFVPFGILFLDELDEQIKQRKDFIVKFAKNWIDEKYPFLNSGISLFYLCYILALEKGDAFFKKYLISNSIGPDDEDSIQIEAKKLFNRIKRET